jgi:hypothetical protein
MALLSALSFGAAIFANATSTQLPGPMTANAPEKMMPHEKAQKMRECARRAEQQKIETKDRARFINECVGTK